MREAHLDVFEANSDIINGVQWVSNPGQQNDAPVPRPGRQGMEHTGKPMTLKELEAKIEDVKYEAVTEQGLFPRSMTK